MLNSAISLEHPLSLLETITRTSEVSTIAAVDDYKTILFVVEKSTRSKDDASQDGIYTYYASIDEASLLVDPLSKNLFTPDFIVISSGLENYTDRYLRQLKEFAAFRNIPFILHSASFNTISKNIAVEFGFDDYYTGEISTAFVKKADFIKKLKTYKNKRGDKTYVASQRVDQPQVKMWGLKRTFDIVVSGTLLFLLSPLLVMIALLVRLESKGPIFYISKRAGNGYKIFNFYKFRSMRQGADKDLKTLSHLNQYGDSLFFKIQNDPRITRCGSFLRNTSLDELPQLINVLLGDMSLVGNRPLPLYEAEKLTKDNIAWRFLAPAGITGLWQVTKRGRENMSEEERIQLDMEYAMRNSFFYDLRILLSTIPALLQKEKV